MRALLQSPESVPVDLPELVAAGFAPNPQPENRTARELLTLSAEITTLASAAIAYGGWIRAHRSKMERAQVTIQIVTGGKLLFSSELEDAEESSITRAIEDADVDQVTITIT